MSMSIMSYKNTCWFNCFITIKAQRYFPLQLQCLFTKMLKYVALKTCILKCRLQYYSECCQCRSLSCGFAGSRDGRCLLLLFLREVRNRFFGDNVVQPLAHQIGVDTLQGVGGKYQYTQREHV